MAQASQVGAHLHLYVVYLIRYQAHLHNHDTNNFFTAQVLRLCTPCRLTIYKGNFWLEAGSLDERPNDNR